MKESEMTSDEAEGVFELSWLIELFSGGLEASWSSLVVVRLMLSFVVDVETEGVIADKLGSTGGTGLSDDN